MVHLKKPTYGLENLLNHLSLVRVPVAEAFCGDITYLSYETEARISCGPDSAITLAHPVSIALRDGVAVAVKEGHKLGNAAPARSHEHAWSKPGGRYVYQQPALKVTVLGEHSFGYTLQPKGALSANVLAPFDFMRELGDRVTGRKRRYTYRPPYAYYAGQVSSFSVSYELADDRSCFTAGIIEVDLGLEDKPDFTILLDERTLVFFDEPQKKGSPEGSPEEAEPQTLNLPAEYAGRHFSLQKSRKFPDKKRLVVEGTGSIEQLTLHATCSGRDYWNIRNAAESETGWVQLPSHLISYKKLSRP